MAAADFLVEIGVEELPPKSLPALERNFRSAFRAGLEQAGLGCGPIDAYASPRRLALVGQRLAARQKTQVTERRGPPVAIARDSNGQWSRAALAFARSCGCAPEDLDTLRTGKGAWLAFRERRRGRAASAVLPGIVAEALASLPIPRMMRWGGGEEAFIRPVHWVVMLHGKRVVPATILGCRSGRVSRGHRFMGERRLSVPAAEHYQEALRTRGRVIAGFAARRERLLRQAADRAAALGGELVSSAELADEIAGLVEWPTALDGAFEKRFLRLPEDVIIATLQQHLRFFPVRAPSGSLLPGFVLISNLESRQPASVSAGAKRVVQARLNDAAFFHRRDCEETLADRLPGLKAVRYQQRLGSLGDRADRIESLAGSLAPECGANLKGALRAARLCKADLLTGMVGEFPGLQGVMGEHYARNDGEEERVCAAIGEHYAPRQAGDAIPAGPEGQAVALADRLDQLAGLFATGRRPRGASDPFGLRRAALGVLRICIEGRVDLDLPALLERALSLQPVDTADRRELAQAVHGFMLERLRSWYLDGLHPDSGSFAVTPELFAAVRARNPVSPLDIHRRLKALHGFLQREGANELAAANKRISNILRSADDAGRAAVDEGLLLEPQERALYAAFLRVQPQVRKWLDQRDYTAALDSLTALHAPLGDFFDQVLVMSEDARLRHNRLALLTRLREALRTVADLSLLPGRK